MSPQFVDFDQDGKLDIVAGIFDGSPHVARGSDHGWLAPEQILDRDGQRILANQFWNFDTKKWENTQRCDPDGPPPPEGQITSAWAVDWDGNGTLDLLLGDYKGGRLYLRRDEGTKGKPQFATRNQVVLADGKPLEVPHKMATPRLVDWDQDGLPDLLIGSVGDAYGNEEGGGVYLYRNVGKPGAPAFAAPVTLIPPSQKAAGESPVRPDAGLYMDAGDVDGDGDLDLLVGAYSMWTPQPKVLTAEQAKELAQLQQDLAAVGEERSAIYQDIQKGLAGLDEKVAAQKRDEALKARQADLTRLGKRHQELQARIEPLHSGPKREVFVWYYENLQTTAKPAGAGPQ